MLSDFEGDEIGTMLKATKLMVDMNRGTVRLLKTGQSELKK